MLSGTGINPFESQETKPYKNDPQVNVMMHLVEAFQRSDVEQFNQLLKANRAEVMGDKFIRTFLDDVILSIRCQGMINLVAPYSRVKFEFLSNSLDIPIDTVQEIAMALIVDNRLPNAKIDGVNKTVVILPSSERQLKIAKDQFDFKASGLPFRYKDLVESPLKVVPDRTVALTQWAESVRIAGQLINTRTGFVSKGGLGQA